MPHSTEQTFRILANVIPGHSANRAVQIETNTPSAFRYYNVPMVQETDPTSFIRPTVCSAGRFFTRR
jgi:hypothetical protein